jgi:hypothetical protein
MLIPISLIAFGTQLVVAAADVVPAFDIDRGCRVDSTQAFDLSTGLNETLKRCAADERRARAQLRTQWPRFRAADKMQCVGEADIGGTPGYVDPLTCLQLAKDARQLPK